jgi:hypothetical protein
MRRIPHQMSGKENAKLFEFFLGLATGNSSRELIA